MPYIYCIDDGGDGSQTNATQSAGTLNWSKADASVADLISYDAAAFTTSGNIIYFGDDHADPNKAAHWTLTGPTSGLPVILISADRAQATPTYKKGTGNQLSSLGGAYDLICDGSFALNGLQIAPGRDIILSCDIDEVMFAENCTFKLAANEQLRQKGVVGGRTIIRNCVIDLTADGTTERSPGVIIQDSSGYNEIIGLTFINPGYRTGSVFDSQLTYTSGLMSGCDCSGFPANCELVMYGLYGLMYVTNCKTAATWTPLATLSASSHQSITFTNCGPDDSPTYLYRNDYFATTLSVTSIYRTSGATVEGTATAWLITTTAQCSEGAPAYLPWIYGVVSSTGSKTFDIYITNDTADFTDAEVWPELEYLKDADEALWTCASGHRATITTTAAAQADDTISTWNGTGPSFTYKQKLSVTAVIGETGQFRMRVAVGVASIASSRYFYVDPLVTVS